MCLVLQETEVVNLCQLNIHYHILSLPLGVQGLLNIVYKSFDYLCRDNVLLELQVYFTLFS